MARKRVGWDSAGRMHEPSAVRPPSLTKLCPPRLLGTAESARRQPEREAQAAAGRAAPLPVPSAAHRWASWEVKVTRSRGGKAPEEG